MKSVLFAMSVLLAGCTLVANPIPTGSFVDDYGMHYVITDSTWTQEPGATYRIGARAPQLRMVLLERAATDSTDASYTRVDWLPLEDMEPWTWAYCYTAWDLPTAQAALETRPADATQPLTGCGGFPFSRMQAQP